MFQLPVPAESIIVNEQEYGTECIKRGTNGTYHHNS
jgi:hypothetical protein